MKKQEDPHFAVNVDGAGVMRFRYVKASDVVHMSFKDRVCFMTPEEAKELRDGIKELLSDGR